MDKQTQFNRERWEELAGAGVAFSKPYLDLTMEKARHIADPESVMGDLKGRKVLLLAGGGGQQSPAYAMLGAEVTVLDFSKNQLNRDKEAAEHYGFEIKTLKGDMQDLSALEKDYFDVVYHAHSLNFIPDPLRVFKEVAGVLKKGGYYRLNCTNPFYHGSSAVDWNGKGYTLYHKYIDGEVEYEDNRWDVDTRDGETIKIEGPTEYRHTLGRIINGLISLNFTITGFWEYFADTVDTFNEPDNSAKPGTWKHFKTIAPPWMTIGAVLGK